MAKSILLPLCCVIIVQDLHAQDYRNSGVAAVPQKLELHKNSIASIDPPGAFEASNSADFFAKKPEESDTAQSIVYLGKPRPDTIDLNLPKVKNPDLVYRSATQHPLPLFKNQQ